MINSDYWESDVFKDYAMVYSLPEQTCSYCGKIGKCQIFLVDDVEQSVLCSNCVYLEDV